MAEQTLELEENSRRIQKRRDRTSEKRQQVMRTPLPVPEGQRERERIARAIMGKGDFLSDELKEFLREIEELHVLSAGQASWPQL
jgi:hypothetical protein